MSQNAIALPLVGVYSGATAAGYINNALDTLATKQSGSSAPTGPALGWDWLDTSVANQATWKVYDGSQWCAVGVIDITNHRWSPPVGGGYTTLASAATTDLGSKYQAALQITGVTTITSFGSSAVVGNIKFLNFAGVLTLTHHATNLILPTGANITTAAGDTCIAQQYASGQWIVFAYQKADGTPLVYSGTVTGSFAFSGVLSPAAIAANTDDYAPTNHATNTIWRLSTSGGNSYTISGIASVASGRILFLQNVNAAGAGNITLLSEGTGSTAANRFTGPSAFVLRPGQGVLLEYDNTTQRWRFVNTVQAGGAWASFKKLQVNNNSGTPNSIVDVTADELILEDTDFNTMRLTAVSVSPNMGSSGAGGLDTGAEANSTWYSIWVIYNPATNTVSSLFSTSATAPTMPSGYTFKMRVGWVRNDGSSNFLRFKQFGRRVNYFVVAGSNTANLPQMGSGANGNISTPTWSSLTISNYVPTTATTIRITATPGGSSTTILIAPNADYSNTQGNPPYAANSTSAVVNGAVASAFEMVLEATTIQWASSNASATINCSGWEDNI